MVASLLMAHDLNQARGKIWLRCKQGSIKQDFVVVGSRGAKTKVASLFKRRIDFPGVN